jgi:hypothetical protein
MHPKHIAQGDPKRTTCLPYNAIRRASKGFRRRIGFTPPCDVLLVLDRPRGPLEVQGKNLQLPTHRH